MNNLLILAILSIIPFPLTYIISYPLATFYLIPLFFQLYKTIKKEQIILGEKISEILSFFCLLFFLFDSFFISRRLIIVAIHLTMSLILIKAFSLKTKKDEYLFLLLIFFLISAGISNSFHILLFPYLLICLYFFLQYLLNENNVDQKRSKIFSFTSVVVGMLIATPLFFLFPRIKTPYVPGLSTRGESNALNENILNLNDIENLKKSNEIVMRVKFSKKLEMQRNIYIRLKTFSQYINGVWSSAKPEYKLSKAESFGYFKFSNSIEDYSCEIFTRIFFQNLPILYGANSIEIPLEFINISRDSCFLLPTSLQRKRLKYKIGLSGEMELFYAKEPSMEEIRKIGSNKIKELSKQIFGEEKEVKKKIENLLSYFYKNFEYGIENIDLEEFLFKKKRGHCELFATACALILREGGIPSRVVVGFLGGEMHPWQNYIIVRNSNSHAWVEIYVDGKWNFIDPTPPVFRPSITEGDIQSYLKYIYESISFFWDRNILGFTYAEQIEILNFFKNNISAILNLFYLFLITITSFIFLVFLRQIKLKKKIFYLKYYEKIKKRSIKKYKLPNGIPPESLAIFLKNLYPEKSTYITNFFNLYLDSSFGKRKIKKTELKSYYKKIKSL